MHLLLAAVGLVLAACSSREEAPVPPSTGPRVVAGEVFFGGDPRSAPLKDVAIGGGWLYWVEQPVGGASASRVLRRKSTTDATAAPETLTFPEPIWSIAADEDRVYVGGRSLWSRPHAGPWVPGVAAGRSELAPTTAHEIVVGQRYLMLDAFDRFVLVPKLAGSVATAETETVWEGTHVAHTLGSDGDRFFLVFEQQSYERRTWPMLAVGPGQPLGVFVEAPQLSLRPRHLRVDGGSVYFTGPVPPTATACPTWPGCTTDGSRQLWRLDARRGGSLEHVGQLNGLGNFAIHDGVLIGELFDRQARLVKLSLDRPASQIVVDELVYTELRKTTWPVRVIVADDRHVYYVTIDSTVIRRVAW
jgi:hypothetical protein